jgi:hypothetical protein
MRLAASETVNVVSACGDVEDGEVEDYTINISSSSSACPAPTGANATSITANSANLSWNAVAGASGYQYLVDQNSGSPTANGAPITTTTYPATGLSPATTYYLHVRAVCGGANYSVWTNYPFTTTVAAPCNAPTNIAATAIGSTTATVGWTAATGAIGYEYVVNTSATPPTTAGNPVSTNSATLTPLSPNTTYYVHVRTKCNTTTFSAYATYSFQTTSVTAGCNAPSAVNITGTNATSVQFSWPAVTGSATYEYAITSSTTAPTTGITTVAGTTVNKPGLTPGTVYYIHLRSRCGASITSGWTIKQFATVATGVNELNKDGFAVNVFPNPAGATLRVAFEGVSGKNAQVSVTDLSGRTVLTVPVSGKETTINVSVLSPGLYLLKYSDDKHSDVVRIQKQ